jgi:hypothetical protein
LQLGAKEYNTNCSIDKRNATQIAAQNKGIQHKLQLKTKEYNTNCNLK